MWIRFVSDHLMTVRGFQLTFAFTGSYRYFFLYFVRCILASFTKRSVSFSLSHFICLVEGRKFFVAVDLGCWSKFIKVWIQTQNATALCFCLYAKAILLKTSWQILTDFYSFTIPHLLGCGGVLTAPNGVISSPNFPLNYTANADCVWKIEASEGNQIKVHNSCRTIRKRTCDADRCSRL